MKNVNKIVIFESSRQVDYFFNIYRKNNTIYKIISANSDATWALQKKKITFILIEHFHINKSSIEIEQLQLKQISWAKNLDLFLLGVLREFSSTDFLPTQNFLYYFKNSWDTFIQRADLLEQIYKDEKPDEIIFFYNRDKISYDSNLIISGSVLSECIPLWADFYGIKCTAIPAIQGDYFWEDSKPNLNKLTNKKSSFFHRLIKKNILSITNKIFLVNIFFDTFLPKKGTIIIKNSYDLIKKISFQLQIKGLKIQSFNTIITKSQKYNEPFPLTKYEMIENWKQIANQKWFWEPGGWQKWSLQDILKTMFKHYWFNIIPELWKSFTGSKNYLKKNHPLCLCVPLIYGIKEIGFIMAAKYYNIPIIIYQHGPNAGDIENSTWDIECFPADYLFMYGEGAVNYILSRQISAVPIPIGSARLDLVSLGLSKKRIHSIRQSILKNVNIPLIVYVPGIFANNFYRYSHQGYQHCKTFFIRNELAKIFNKHPEVHFSYKAFISMGYDPSLEMLREICPNCSIITDTALTDLQWAADFLIYENPSTGMCEGIVTDKPMIVHVDRDVYRMPDNVKELLKKRAYITETSQELLISINKILDNGEFMPIKNPNREFSKLFCTYLDDGQSAFRAVNIINEIVSKKFK